MTAEAFKRQLEALSTEYRRDLPQKLAQIENLWHGLARGLEEPARIADLQRELHSLAGSAKTFGVAGVSEAAAVAEAFLGPHVARCETPGAAGQAEFSLLLDVLKRAAA